MDSKFSFAGTLCLSVFILLAFSARSTCAAKEDWLIKLVREKRLSVLNVIYRRGNVDKSYPENRTSSTTTPWPIQLINSTSLMQALDHFTPAPTDLTTAIAKLRTTRMKFSMSTRHPVVSWAGGEAIEPDTQFDNRIGGPTLETRRVPAPRGRVPHEMYPFLPLPDGKVTLDLSADSPLTPRQDSSKIRDQPFFAVTRPPNTIFMRVDPTTPVFPVLPTRTRPTLINPSFHEFVPPAVQLPATPSSALHARLNINTPDKRKTNSPHRGPIPTTTTSSVESFTSSPSNFSNNSQVTGAPANVSCRGKIGYFSDLTPDCNTFLYCDQFGRSFRFLCPNGTRFNSRLCVCDVHSLCAKAGPIVALSDPCPPLM